MARQRCSPFGCVVHFFHPSCLWSRFHTFSVSGELTTTNSGPMTCQLGEAKLARLIGQVTLAWHTFLQQDVEYLTSKSATRFLRICMVVARGHLHLDAKFGSSADDVVGVGTRRIRQRHDFARDPTCLLHQSKRHRDNGCLAQRTTTRLDLRISVTTCCHDVRCTFFSLKGPSRFEFT